MSRIGTSNGTISRIMKVATIARIGIFFRVSIFLVGFCRVRVVGDGSGMRHRAPRMGSHMPRVARAKPSHGGLTCNSPIATGHNHSRLSRFPYISSPMDPWGSSRSSPEHCLTSIVRARGIEREGLHGLCIKDCRNQWPSSPRLIRAMLGLAIWIMQIRVVVCPNEPDNPGGDTYLYLLVLMWVRNKSGQLRASQMAIAILDAGSGSSSLTGDDTVGFTHPHSLVAFSGLFLYDIAFSSSFTWQSLQYSINFTFTQPFLAKDASIFLTRSPAPHSNQSLS